MPDAAEPGRGVGRLDVNGVGVSLGVDRREFPVIEDVSFSLKSGETLGIVGESGCGKSMLALSLIRCLPPAARIVAGSVVWNGIDLGSISTRKLNQIRGRDIGMIFQNPRAALNPTRKVGAQLVETLHRHADTPRREARRRAVELLEEVQLPSARQKVAAYPHELSGGMCQRVMIAIALASSPQLLIADEPTTALDATIEAEILSVLRELQAARGMAMLMISHDMRVVTNIADRVAVMYAGEFVEEGPAADVLVSPQHPYTEALLECVPSLVGPSMRRTRVQTIGGRPPRLGEWASGCRFAPRCPYSGRDGCADERQAMRQVGPRHWVRTAHARVDPRPGHLASPESSERRTYA